MSNKFVPAVNNSAQHRLFRSDGRLSPEEINDLLGIRVRLDRDHGFAVQQKEETSCLRLFRFAFLMLLLVSFALLGSMYQLKIGPFYESKIASTSLN